MKPFKNRDKFLELLQKTNDFLVVLSVRYGVESGQYIIKKTLQIPTMKNLLEEKEINLVVLSAYFFKESIKKEIRTEISNVSKKVGIVREYLICSLEQQNNSRFDKKEINNCIDIMNKKYKLYFDEIHTQNILGDFLTKKEVKDELLQMFLINESN